MSHIYMIYIYIMGNKALQKKRFIFPAAFSQIRVFSVTKAKCKFFLKNLNVPELKYQKTPNYRKMV